MVIGNAENDHAFLKLCGCAVAVSNALPALKEMAHIVTAASHGAGVAEIIDRLIDTDLTEIAPAMGENASRNNPRMFLPGLGLNASESP